MVCDQRLELTNPSAGYIANHMSFMLDLLKVPRPHAGAVDGRRHLWAVAAWIAAFHSGRRRRRHELQ